MTITVGDKGLDIRIRYLDQNGAEMTGVVTDAPPAWTQSNPEVEKLTVAADAQTAHADGTQAGSDTVSVALSVGGTAFTPSLVSDVVGGAPKVTTVDLVATPTA